MANDKFIEEIGGKLREHSSEVNPQMWQNVSSQIGAGTSGAAGGLGLAKSAVIIGITVTTAIATYFVVNSSKENTNKVIAQKEISQPKSTTEKNVTTPEEKVDNTKPTNSQEKNEVQLVNNQEVPKIGDEQKQEKENENVSPVIEKIQGEILTPNAPEDLLSKRVNSMTTPPTKPTEDKQAPRAEKSIENQTQTKQAAKEEKQISSAEIMSLPNIFTPNNDGINDYFFVESKGLVNYALVVLDANSKVVWKSTQANEKWDGRDQGGEKLPNGRYVYFITAEDESGAKVNKYQNLEIR